VNAGIEGAKQRFRQVATRGPKDKPAAGVEEAKTKLRLTAEGFDQIGDELIRHLGMAELRVWVKKDPWRATLSAAVGGFLAGNLRESELLLLSLLLRLLDLTGFEARRR
jgi:hypothetical protein